MSDLHKIVELSKVIVYGAGSVAKHILPYLQSMEADSALSILGIAVTSPAQNNNSLNGMPIQSIESYLDHTSDAAVIIAVSPEIAKEITPILEKLAFRHVFPLTIELRDEILSFELRKKMQELGMLPSEKVWTLGGVKILNPDFLSVPNASNIINQVAELLFPPILNDYSMVVEGPYEHEGVSISQGDIVFDCGANMGVFSAYSASKASKVIAFDPLQCLSGLIQQHIDLNGTGTILNVGLGKENALLPFSENSYNIGGSSFVKHSSDKTSQIMCRTVDSVVDELNLPRVDFIKADIEGAERLMLLGAQETLKHFAPKLSICTYHLPDDPQVLEEIIKKANPAYTVVHKWEKLFAWVEK